MVYGILYMVYDAWYRTIWILQTIVSGIPVVLALNQNVGYIGLRSGLTKSTEYPSRGAFQERSSRYCARPQLPCRLGGVYGRACSPMPGGLDEGLCMAVTP